MFKCSHESFTVTLKKTCSSQRQRKRHCQNYGLFYITRILHSVANPYFRKGSNSMFFIWEVCKCCHHYGSVRRVLAFSLSWINPLSPSQDTFSRFILKSAECTFSESSSTSELVGETLVFHLQLIAWFAVHQRATSPPSQQRDGFHWLHQKMFSSLFANLLRAPVSVPWANEGSDRYSTILPTLTCPLRLHSAFFSIALDFYLLP